MSFFFQPHQVACGILVPKQGWKLHCLQWMHRAIFKIRFYWNICFSSVQFSHSVVTQSDSLWPHGLQHAMLPCPSLSPAVCLNSHPLSWWCNLTIASSATPFAFCLQSFPASGSFQWVSSLHLAARVLEFQLQHQSFQWMFRVDLLWLDWFDIFAVQGILKSLLQHQN